MNSLKKDDLEGSAQGFEASKDVVSKAKSGPGEPIPLSAEVLDALALEDWSDDDNGEGLQDLRNTALPAETASGGCSLGDRRPKSATDDAQVEGTKRFVYTGANRGVTVSDESQSKGEPPNEDKPRSTVLNCTAQTFEHGQRFDVVQIRETTHFQIKARDNRSSGNDEFHPHFFIPQSERDLIISHGRASQPFWSYDLYRDSSGKKVKVFYCTTIAQSEACAKRFENEPVIGFDMEWKPRYVPGIKNNISLIQVASETEIGLFHIAVHLGNSAIELVAPTLKKIIESPNIIKTGVGIFNADGKRLKRYLQIQPRGLFELSNLYKLVKYGASKPHLVNDRLVGLATLTKLELGLPLAKGPVRCSDWSKPQLDRVQIEYAANDAYAGYQLFRIMDRKRLKMSPTPPLPPFKELRLPILLPQGGTSGLVGGWQNDGPVYGLPSPDLDAESAAIFEKLSAWAQGTAATRGVLVQEIVEDVILKDIARAKPVTMEQLMWINGPQKENSEISEQWLSIILDQKKTQRISLPACRKSEETALNTTPPDPASSTATLSLARTALNISPSMADLEDMIKNTTIAHRDPSLEPPKTEKVAKPGLDTVGQQLYSALCGLRIRLASKSQLTSTCIASDDVLWEIAKRRPSTHAELWDIIDIQGLVTTTKKCGVSIVDFVSKYGTLSTAREPGQVFSDSVILDAG